MYLLFVCMYEYFMLFLSFVFFFFLMQYLFIDAVSIDLSYLSFLCEGFSLYCPFLSVKQWEHSCIYLKY